MVAREPPQVIYRGSDSEVRRRIGDAPIEPEKRSVGRDRLRVPPLDRHDADPDDGRADGGHTEFDRPPADVQWLILGRPGPS